VILGLVLVTIAAVPVLACLGAALTFASRFRPDPAEPVAEPVPLSVLVPVKGADAATGDNFEALVASHLPGPVEYRFAMESADDPAYAVAERVRRRHPDLDIAVVVTGPAGDRMGKQHNLVVAAAGAKHPTIASMDADVRVEPDTLATGLRALTAPDAGVVYLLPRYRGPGPAGGVLVAIYSNLYYQLYMGAFALTRNAPFITGGLWLMSPAARERIGGLEPFTTTVSDDAAIGRAVVAVGLRNQLVPRTVSIPYEPVSLTGGVRHLLKWLTLLRAEGLATYLAILLTWHPVLMAGLALLATAVLPVARPALPVALVVAAAALAVRLLATAVLVRRAYPGTGLPTALWSVPYELLAVPVLFARGLFARSLVWRGIRYEIGRRGEVRSVRRDRQGST
jgi:ceramide glucosyltransferase